MSDVRVAATHDPTTFVSGVPTNGSGGRQAPRERSPRERRQRAGAEELAVALKETGRGPLRADFTVDAEGHALIRIVDPERDETVAVVTPEELRELAERTGLPPGLLVQALS